MVDIFFASKNRSTLVVRVFELIYQKKNARAGKGRALLVTMSLISARDVPEFLGLVWLADYQWLRFLIYERICHGE